MSIVPFFGLAETGFTSGSSSLTGVDASGFESALRNALARDGAPPFSQLLRSPVSSSAPQSDIQALGKSFREGFSGFLSQTTETSQTTAEESETDAALAINPLAVLSAPEAVAPKGMDILTASLQVTEQDGQPVQVAPVSDSSTPQNVPSFATDVTRPTSNTLYDGRVVTGEGAEVAPNTSVPGRATGFGELLTKADSVTAPTLSLVSVPASDTIVQSPLAADAKASAAALAPSRFSALETTAFTNILQTGQPEAQAVVRVTHSGVALGQPTQQSSDPARPARHVGVDLSVRETVSPEFQKIAIDAQAGATNRVRPDVQMAAQLSQPDQKAVQLPPASFNASQNLEVQRDVSQAPKAAGQAPADPDQPLATSRQSSPVSVTETSISSRTVPSTVSAPKRATHPTSAVEQPQPAKTDAVARQPQHVAAMAATPAQAATGFVSGPLAAIPAQASSLMQSSAMPAEMKALNTAPAEASSPRVPADSAKSADGSKAGTVQSDAKSDVKPAAQPVTPSQPTSPAPVTAASTDNSVALLPETDADPLIQTEDTPDLLPQDKSVQTPVSRGIDAVTNAPRAANPSQAAAVLSQVSNRMLERFDGKTSKFEIRLDPAELGKVDVRVEVDRDGRVHAVLAAQDPTAADALTRGLRSLENALTQAGLSLSEDGVKVEVNDRQAGGHGHDWSAEGEADDAQNAPQDEEIRRADAFVSRNTEIEIWSQSRLDVRA